MTFPAMILLTLALGAHAARAQDEGEGPAATNVVVIVADDLGIGDLSCYGGSIPTPHIDALASSGVRFTRAYATAPTCGPSRAGYLSGRQQLGFGFEFNIGKSNLSANRERGLPREVPVLPEWLHARGRATGMVGKWHLGSNTDAHPLERGFDSFFGFMDGAHPYLPTTRRGQNGPLVRDRVPVEEGAYLTDAFARESVAFIEANRERPYFLYAAFSAPHRPHEATDEYLERFPDLAGGERIYAAMVSALDDGVGEIVAAVERSGAAERTVVVFFSDNGAVAGDGEGSNGELALGKFFLFEGGVRVPLIVRDPRRAARGRVVDAPVSTLDLAPTVLAACDIPHEGLALEGRDLAPWLDGDSPQGAPARLLWRAGVSAALCDGDLKLIQSHGQRWLYRLSEDPAEANDLSGELEAELAAMTGELESWSAALPAPLWPGKRLERKPIVAGRVYLADY